MKRRPAKSQGELFDTTPQITPAESVEANPEGRGSRHGSRRGRGSANIPQYSNMVFPEYRIEYR
jgi:hypothetical protein